MPSFNCDSFIKVYEVHRANLDVGYNIYHTRLRLGPNTVVPISTAHQTSDPHLWSGSRARTTAVVAVRGRSLLYTANDVSLVGFNSIPESTDKPADYLDLPRFMLDGYVTNPYIIDRDIPGAFAFDVRIERPELAPYHCTDVRCWVNREKQRFNEADITGLVKNALVTVTGRFCGWSNIDDHVMLDVHDMCFSPDGEVPENTLGISLRFWERATWADGLANFHGVRGPPPPTTGYTISILAKPSLRAPGTHPLGVPMPQGWTPAYSGPTRHVQLTRTPLGERARDEPAAPAVDPAPDAAPAAERAPASSDDDDGAATAVQPSRASPDETRHAPQVSASSDEDAGVAIGIPRPRPPTPRGAPEVLATADEAAGPALAVPRPRAPFLIKLPPFAKRTNVRATRGDEPIRAAGVGTSGIAAAGSRHEHDSLSPSPPSSVVAEPPTPARTVAATTSVDVDMDDAVDVPAVETPAVEAPAIEAPAANAHDVDAHDDVDMDADEYFPYRAGKRKRPTRGYRGLAAKVDPAFRTIG